MPKNVATIITKAQVTGNKFCTQSVDKIVRKRTIRRQVH